MSAEDMSTDCVTVTVRLIRSFEHRTIKHVVFKDVTTSQTVEHFVTAILQALLALIHKTELPGDQLQKNSGMKFHLNPTTDLKTRPGIPPLFRKHEYDTLKISHQPFGAKTSDPVINKENDDLILAGDATLQQSNIVNETELSFFKLEEYRAYQQNPQLVW